MRLYEKIKVGDQIYYRPSSLMTTVTGIDKEQKLIMVEDAKGEPYAIDFDWLDTKDFTWYPQKTKRDAGPVCKCDLWSGCKCGRLEWERQQQRV